MSEQPNKPGDDSDNWDVSEHEINKMSNVEIGQIKDIKKESMSQVNSPPDIIQSAENIEAIGDISDKVSSQHSLKSKDNLPNRTSAANIKKGDTKRSESLVQKVEENNEDTKIEGENEETYLESQKKFLNDNSSTYYYKQTKIDGE